MYHENQIIELFTGYAHLDSLKHQMKANSSVTLVKGENKTVLVENNFVGKQKSNKVIRVF
jgi:glyoxylase-like metal-dependent hydrolase (beta-lactamase superfamily II)